MRISSLAAAAAAVAVDGVTVVAKDRGASCTLAVSDVKTTESIECSFSSDSILTTVDAVVDVGIFGSPMLDHDGPVERSVAAESFDPLACPTNELSN